uniref:Uncharacterized protein n=1 Tax=Anguilla anguilla TaxID=7936 RepID=A0A0E9R272_ANGAN
MNVTCNVTLSLFEYMWSLRIRPEIQFSCICVIGR